MLLSSWVRAETTALSAHAHHIARSRHRQRRHGKQWHLPSWKGIPYARPPVAALRWKAPADATPWKSPRLAQQFANACASLGRLYGPGFNNRYDASIGASLEKLVGSEDCLYLNIWRPATAAQKLPVIVFVHGGSNITGYTADPVYDGANLARTANAIVVTVNYRLGVLGFFRSPYLRTGDPKDDSGNFALLDIIKSLQFIHRNIASFGGDAGNVTLMGESAGAVNVYALMTSPLLVKANPSLVHRVLPMSGGISRAEDLPAGALPVLVPVSPIRRSVECLGHGALDRRWAGHRCGHGADLYRLTPRPMRSQAIFAARAPTPF